MFFGISSGLILLLIAYLDGLFFLSDPFVILATRFPPKGNQEIFEQTMLLKNFCQFLVLPIFGAFVHTNIKNKLVKENFEIHGRFKDNLRFVIETMIINGAMFGVYLIIANFVI